MPSKKQSRKSAARKKAQMIYHHKNSSSTIAESLAQQKLLKIQLKAQEEQAFRESIAHLGPLDQQKMVYERLNEKAKKKRIKEEKRQIILQNPNADMVAQQQAIMAQIAQEKVNQRANNAGDAEYEAPIAAFGVYQ